jgi:hypothetical protein
MSIDHHGDIASLYRPISSANLALTWVRNGGGPAGPGSLVVVHHADCDSVLSSAIVAGEIEPLEIYGEAAIAADHTGEPHEIADLLQALEERVNRELSLRVLRTFIETGRIDDEAAPLLALRRAKRNAALDVAKSGAFTVEAGGLAWAVLDEGRVEGEFFPAALASVGIEASVIVIFAPQRNGSTKVKLRLGLGAPAGFTLKELRLEEFDSNYGGRWNAGSNSRGGGTTLAPRDYAAELQKRLMAALNP